MTTLLTQLETIVGSSGFSTDPDVLHAHAGDWSQEAAQPPLALVRPSDTLQVSRVLDACAARRQPIVVQGGLTGLCGAATPRPGEIALSLDRLSDIDEVTPAEMTVAVGAGVRLQALQEAAAQQGYLFPLDMGARGSCTIGGNIATNAGGSRVIRYGTMRNLVLALEVVLADGSIIPARQRTLKDTTGYDLKQWFVGSEGTLGVITKAVLRVQPHPSNWSSAMLVARSLDSLEAILGALRSSLTGGPSAFEVMWSEYWNVATSLPGASDLGLSVNDGFCLLVEHEGFDDATDSARFSAVLGRLLEQDLISDAIVAQSDRERATFWKTREAVAEILGAMQHPIAFDLGMPIAVMGVYMDRLRACLGSRFSETTVLAMGHLGDGTLHLVIDAVDLSAAGPLEALVYDTAKTLGASISTEHGIGMLKAPYLRYSRAQTEVDLMRQMKRMMDPGLILGRGRIFGDGSGVTG